MEDHSAWGELATSCSVCPRYPDLAIRQSTSRDGKVRRFWLKNTHLSFIIADSVTHMTLRCGTYSRRSVFTDQDILHEYITPAVKCMVLLESITHMDDVRRAIARNAPLDHPSQQGIMVEIVLSPRQRWLRPRYKVRFLAPKDEPFTAILSYSEHFWLMPHDNEYGDTSGPRRFKDAHSFIRFIEQDWSDWRWP
jgi:hypothetical protein